MTWVGRSGAVPSGVSHSSNLRSSPGGVVIGRPSCVGRLIVSHRRTGSSRPGDAGDPVGRAAAAAAESVHQCGGAAGELRRFAVGRPSGSRPPAASRPAAPSAAGSWRWRRSTARSTISSTARSHRAAPADGRVAVLGQYSTLARPGNSASNSASPSRLIHGPGAGARSPRPASRAVDLRRAQDPLRGRGSRRPRSPSSAASDRRPEGSVPPCPPGTPAFRRSSGRTRSAGEHFGEVPGERLHRQVAVVHHAVQAQQDAAGGGRHAASVAGRLPSSCASHPVLPHGRSRCPDPRRPPGPGARAGGGQGADAPIRGQPHRLEVPPRVGFHGLGWRRRRPAAGAGAGRRRRGGRGGERGGRRAGRRPGVDLGGRLPATRGHRAGIRAGAGRPIGVAAGRSVVRPRSEFGHPVPHRSSLPDRHRGRTVGARSGHPAGPGGAGRGRRRCGR